MYLSKIKIKNFKSFSNVSVNLKDFNVFVGESASGKSNFIESLIKSNSQTIIYQQVEFLIFHLVPY